jgi:hypothetical protein
MARAIGEWSWVFNKKLLQGNSKDKVPGYEHVERKKFQG